MTIIAFYPVGNALGWGRDADELCSPNDDTNFKNLWENREKLGARIYSPEGSPAVRELYTLDELVDDYNNEDYDGGWWMVTMRPKDAVAWGLILNED